VRVPDVTDSSLRGYLERVVPRSVECADLILVDSIATRDDLMELYGVGLDRVVVLYPGVCLGVGFGGMTTRNHLTSNNIPYILAVGTLQPRKNFPRLIHALARLRSRGYDIDLVIAGSHGWLTESIRDAIIETKLEERVHLLGYVDDKDLPALYAGAACFAFPSLYEGFGIPILEAMAYGTPVVTSNVSSMPEVAGDAALLVDPYDIEAITDALQHLIEDQALRDALIKRGSERASYFTWESSARQLQQIYMDVLGR